MKKTSLSYICSLFLIVCFITPHYLNGKTFRVPVDTIPKILDPTKILDISSAFIMGQTFDTLYEYSPTNNLVPRIAKSHRISPDGKNIIIEINTNLKFSDGSALTVTDVVMSFARAIKAMGVSIKWAFGELEGFDEFINDTSNKKILPSGLKIVSNNKIKFSLKTPFPHFLQVLPAPYFAIIKQNPKGLIGTGDYQLTSNSTDNLTLIKRKDCEKINKRSPSKIEFIKVGNKDEAIKLAYNDLVDFTVVQNTKVIDRKKSTNFDYKTFDYLQSIILQFNLKDDLFSSSSYRHQFAKTFAQIITKSKYKLEPTAIGVPLSWNLFEYPKNQTKNSINFEYKNNRTQKVKVLVAGSEGIFLEDFNRELSINLAKKGFEVTFSGQPLAKFFKKLQTGDFEVALWGYIPDYLDPDAFLTPLLKTNQQYNFSKFSNHTVDTLLSLARELPDQLSRRLTFDKVFSILQQDNPVYFLGSQSGSFIISKKWQLDTIPGLGLHTIKIRNIMGVQ